ncbi:MAG TPA: recombinase RecA [Candidatus Hydrothermia bacterium]|nr:recombinase RecA [Candidatus Hydrothermae bacterium]MDD3649717.1 recombinase RecA [Candidatus Hydrothermia bacterium]MDD5573511.1 recombinase RecA [Candidatus Hydrothermia bacterium]HOK23824.1 recombinase RecA [Candidatus Hydrothermia bacterium]HOL24623.1 recombinase RecA [Candidatus Hydrothermia bacterium]
MEQDEKNLEKERMLEATIKQIEKQYGPGSVMKLGEATQINVEVIPTGSFGLDLVTGIGGYPRGRVIEIYGPEASGKTTLALHAIAETHKLGGKAAFIDAEHALDPIYAKAVGVNVDELIISQPDTGEQALEIMEMLVRSNAIDLIVVDSVAALVPRAEVEGEMGDAQVGLQARLMSKAMRKLVGVLSKSKTCAIFINQIRQQIQTGFGFGNPETTPGGLALKFHASMRLEIRKIASIKQGEEIIGNRVKVRIVKNKLSPPFKTTEFDIIYGEGISYEGELIDMGLEHGIIKRSGTWFSFKDYQLGQGREKARLFLKENPDIRKELEQELKQAVGFG